METCSCCRLVNSSMFSVMNILETDNRRDDLIITNWDEKGYLCRSCWDRIENLASLLSSFIAAAEPQPESGPASSTKPRRARSNNKKAPNAIR